MHTPREPPKADRPSPRKKARKVHGLREGSSSTEIMCVAISRSLRRTTSEASSLGRFDAASTSVFASYGISSLESEGFLLKTPLVLSGASMKKDIGYANLPRWRLQAFYVRHSFVPLFWITPALPIYMCSMSKLRQKTAWERSMSREIIKKHTG